MHILPPCDTRRARAAFRGDEKSEQLLMINPAAAFLAEYFGKVNASTFDRFKDPHLVQKDGKQYDPRKPSEDIVPRPHGGMLGLHGALPKLEGHARRFLAYPNEPTRFTNFGDASAARGGYPAETLRQADPATEIYNAILKMRPIEARMTKDEEARMKAQRQAEVLRAAAVQQDRFKHDPTVIERLLGGGL